jgi:hypothetical protein
MPHGMRIAILNPENIEEMTDHTVEENPHDNDQPTNRRAFVRFGGR